MILGGKALSGAALAAVAFAGLAAIFGVRHYLRSRPPPLSALSLQLAGQMQGAYFELKDSGFRLPYRLYVPASLEANRRYPLLVYLHGAGDNGSENLRQLGPFVGELIGLARSAEPAFILAPQAPAGKNWVNVPGAPYLNWSERDLPENDSIKAIRALLRELPARYPIDQDRVVVLGFSAGAAGSWDLLTRTDSHPFAAAAMLSGAFDPSRAALVARTPLWFFHGAEDTISPFSTTLQTVEALQAAGGAPRYTLCPGIGHETRHSALKDGVYEWLLGQRRSARDSHSASAP